MKEFTDVFKDAFKSFDSDAPLTVESVKDAVLNTATVIRESFSQEECFSVMVHLTLKELKEELTIAEEVVLSATHMINAERLIVRSNAANN